MAGFDELALLLANEIANNAAENNTIRIVRQPRDCFELSETKFKQLFRVNKQMADEIINWLEPFMKDKSTSLSLSAEEKVCNI